MATRRPFWFRRSCGCWIISRFRRRFITAAVRNARQIAEAAVAGARCVTAGFAVYQESFRNPYTDFGEGVFRACLGRDAPRGRAIPQNGPQQPAHKKK